MSARAAALGIGYQLWLRSRWLLLAIMAGAGVLSIAVHLIPSPEAAGVVALLGSLPIGFAVVMLMGIVAYSGDMSATESGFPRHMMVLPLSNRAMALTPLLYGLACVAALWIIVGRLVLMPGGWPVPILWPAVMLAALTVWLQATSWMPFWFPFARVAACVGSLFAVCGFACVAQAFQFPEPVLLGGLVAAIGIAMPIAVAGVARARRGAGSMPSWVPVFALPRAAPAVGPSHRPSGAGLAGVAPQLHHAADLRPSAVAVHAPGMGVARSTRSTGANLPGRPHRPRAIVLVGGVPAIASTDGGRLRRKYRKAGRLGKATGIVLFRGGPSDGRCDLGHCQAQGLRAVRRVHMGAGARKPHSGVVQSP